MFKTLSSPQYLKIIMSRSSAGSRLSDHISNSDPSLPFKHWKVETVCSWLEHLGLFMYVTEVRKQIQYGEQLMMVKNNSFFF